MTVASLQEQSADPPLRGGRPPRLLAIVDRGIGLLVGGAMVLSWICVAAIIGVGAGDVVGRLVFNSPILGAVEITEALLATAIFLGLAYALEQNQHIVVDVLTQSLALQWRLILHLIALVAMLAVMLLLSWQGLLSAQRAWDVTEIAAGYLPVPVWISKALAFAGLSITALEATRQLVWLMCSWNLSAGSRRRPYPVCDEGSAGEA